MMNGTSQSKTWHPKRGLLWSALVAVGLIAALMAACDGGGEGSPTAQPTGEGSPAAQSTTTQAATSTACQALASLKSYRYVSNLTLESPEELVPSTEGEPTPVTTITRDFGGRYHFEYNVDASFVAPDRIAASIATEAGDPFNATVIGDMAWVSLAGQWQETPAPYGVPYQPIDVCNGIFPELSLDQPQGEKETVNEVAARHYAFPAMPSGQAMAVIFGPGSDMDVLIRTMNVEVWVAEKDGWPVRMDVQGSGVYSDGRELRAHVRVELRDINDDDIKVEPPI